MKECDNCIHYKVCASPYQYWDENFKEENGISDCTNYYELSKGEWIVTEDGCECSVCGLRTYEYKPNFCSNCGADMRESNEE